MAGRRWPESWRGTLANEAGGIVLVAVDGHARRTLLAAQRHCLLRVACISPDGRELAYAACEGVLQCRVYVVGLSPSLEVAGTPRRVSNEFEVVSGIAWSEDQRSVIYGAASVWLNTFHLWKVPAAGDRAPERIDVAGIAAMPSISTSSHRLAFARRHFDLTVWQVQEGRAPLPIVASSQSDYDAVLLSGRKPDCVCHRPARRWKRSLDRERGRIRVEVADQGHAADPGQSTMVT